MTPCVTGCHIGNLWHKITKFGNLAPAGPEILANTATKAAWRVTYIELGNATKAVWCVTDHGYHKMERDSRGSSSSVCLSFTPGISIYKCHFYAHKCHLYIMWSHIKLYKSNINCPISFTYKLKSPVWLWTQNINISRLWITLNIKWVGIRVSQYIEAWYT
jgi:hypothetical protein